MTRSLRRSLSLCAATGAALLLLGCVSAAIAGGAVGAGIVAAVLVSNCHEPVSVQVWDHTSSYPVCDAEVTAERDGHVTTFSPCYQTYLGTGTWKITASKPGYPNATGTVEVSKNRTCSEPSFHSLDLTLGTDAALSPQNAPTRPRPLPSAPPSAPASAAPPASPPPPATSTPPSPAAPAATTPAAAPGSAVPSAPFPASSAPGTEVPAPATR